MPSPGQPRPSDIILARLCKFNKDWTPETIKVEDDLLVVRNCLAQAISVTQDTAAWAQDFDNVLYTKNKPEDNNWKRWCRTFTLNLSALARCLGYHAPQLRKVIGIQNAAISNLKVELFYRGPLERGLSKPTTPAVDKSLETAADILEKAASEVLKIQALLRLICDEWFSVGPSAPVGSVA